jgi:hypothetical protein
VSDPLSFLRSVFIIVLLAASTIVSAQMKSGYRFGINLTSLTIVSNSIVSDPERPMGIHFGANYNIPAGRKISFLFGFVFTSKGSDYKIDNTDISIAPTYLEIPVNLSYNFGSRSTRLSLYAGPYSACTIGGYKIVAGGEYTYLTFGRGENKDLRYLDFGLNLGAGLHYKSYMFSVQYGIGLKNISPTNNSIIRNNVIGISISSLRKYE